ncbi:acyl carrier protein [Haloarcula sp. CGMCC 1.2071]|uniref:acyl carrier protein n=1 Tax=Haloarcula sp. CGMCC 1.2071 TaxID=3111454 RepID=UPI00300F647F
MPQTDADVESTLREILNDILRIKDGAEEIEELDAQLSLTDDLGLESIELAEMTVRIEDEYGVDVFEDEVVDEIGTVVEKIRQR